MPHTYYNGVEYCEHNENLICRLKKEIESNKKLAQEFITNIVKLKSNTEEDE